MCPPDTASSSSSSSGAELLLKPRGTPTTTRCSPGARHNAKEGEPLVFSNVSLPLGASKGFASKCRFCTAGRRGSGCRWRRFNSITSRPFSPSPLASAFNSFRRPPWVSALPPQTKPRCRVPRGSRARRESLDLANVESPLEPYPLCSGPGVPTERSRGESLNSNAV